MANDFERYVVKLFAAAREFRDDLQRCVQQEVYRTNAVCERMKAEGQSNERIIAEWGDCDTRLRGVRQYIDKLNADLVGAAVHYRLPLIDVPSQQIRYDLEHLQQLAASLADGRV